MRDGEDISRQRAKELRQTMPNAEVILWSRLKARQLGNLRFRRQHPIGPYIADFACIERMTVIELDGDQHAMPEAEVHDRMRDAYMRKLGWRIIRIGNLAVYKELPETLEYLLRELQIPPPALQATSPVNGGGKDIQ